MFFFLSKSAVVVGFVGSLCYVTAYSDESKTIYIRGRLVHGHVSDLCRRKLIFSVTSPKKNVLIVNTSGDGFNTPNF